jgi:hypothetical protein
MKKQIIATIMTLLVLLLAYFGLQAYAHAKKYESATLKLAQQQSAEKQAHFQLKALAEALSLGEYQNDKRIIREEIAKEAKIHQKAAKKNALYAIGILVVVLAGSLLGGLQTFTFFGGLSALVVLYFGLFSPILMVTIHKEVEYIGDVVLSFESKSVIGSIVKLWDEEPVVSMVILLFSVLVPFFKTVSLMFVAVVMKSRFAHGIVKFFKMIGKWSMVDVFVVATLLVYMTGSGSDVSRAQIQVGMYFFLTYVIVSMLVSIGADKMLENAR